MGLITSLIFGSSSEIMKETLTLESADLKKLKRQLIPILAFPFIAIAMFSVFFYFFFSGDNSITSDRIGKYMMIGFGVFFFGIIGYMIWSATVDIKRGVKFRITGKVTDKRLDVQTTTSHGTGGGRTGSGSSSTRTTRRYFVYIDNEEYSLDYKHYTKVKVGQSVVLDLAPKSNFTLNLEITGQTEENEEAVQEQAASDRKFLESTFEEVRFNDQDLEALKRGYRADVKARMVWMAPFLLIDIGMIANGLWGFLIFLFPLVIIPLYQIFKLIKIYTRYQNNKLHSHKKGITTIVEDKSTYTSNRSGSSNNVRTTQGILKVSSVMYDKLNIGDKIIIFKPKEGKNPLSLMTLDKQEYYLY